jgi:hypothetical protein
LKVTSLGGVTEWKDGLDQALDSLLH